MTITNAQRDQVYETATAQQRHLYADPESGRRLWAIAEKYSLTKDQTYTDFVILVGDVVLGLRNQAELPKLLSETLRISTEQAVKVTGDLIDFLDQKPGTPPTGDLASDIAEVEATLNTVPQVRTMAKDMSATQATSETTYSSTQEAILKEGKANTQPTPIPPPPKKS